VQQEHHEPDYQHRLHALMSPMPVYFHLAIQLLSQAVVRPAWQFKQEKIMMGPLDVTCDRMWYEIGHTGFFLK